MKKLRLILVAVLSFNSMNSMDQNIQCFCAPDLANGLMILGGTVLLAGAVCLCAIRDSTIKYGEHMRKSKPCRNLKCDSYAELCYDCAKK